MTTTNKEAEAALTKGNNAFENKDFDSAIIYFTKAIELDPNYAITYNNRGEAYSNLEQYPEALVDYTKAIELDPNYAIAYNNRGEAYSNLANHPTGTPDAIADFTKAIELDPKLAAAYFNRARNALPPVEGLIIEWTYIIS